MGDENSLAGTTKAHKHTSPASDGGFLETTETGVTNMSAGSIGYYSASSVLTELTAGNSADVLTMGATNPAWSAPVSSAVWTELFNARNVASSNTMDTGAQTDWGTYRVLKYYWTAYVDTGDNALDLQFYNVDGTLETASIQGVAGFYNSNTLNQTANQSSYDLTFGNTIANDRNIVLEITVLCAGVDNLGAGGSYSLTQRGGSGESYNVTYCNGTLAQAWNSGVTSTNLMPYCGCKLQSPATFTGLLLTVLGMGDNTS